MNDLERIELKKQIEEAVEPATVLDANAIRESIESIAVIDTEIPLSFVNRYYNALKYIDDPFEIAKLVTVMLMSSVNAYVEKELSLLGLELTEDEHQQCQERCFERITAYVSDHLKIADLMKQDMRRYARALGLYLLNYSFRSINKVHGWQLIANQLAEVNKWKRLKADITNFVTIVTGETYDKANQLGNVQVVHYATPVLDALGREVMERIRSGRLDELNMKDILKQFGDMCRLVADVKGDTATKIDVSHNLSGIFAAINEMKTKGITVEKPERKLIE